MDTRHCKNNFLFKEKLTNINPHAVLSFGETYNSFVLLSTLFIRPKVLVSDRSKPDKKWGLIQDFLRKYLYRNAAGIIAQTIYSKDFIYTLTKHKNIAVFNYSRQSCLNFWRH